MKSCAHSSSILSLSLSLSLKSLNGVLVEWSRVQETPVGSASGVGFVSTANSGGMGFQLVILDTTMRQCKIWGFE
ncbi:hypothetical protein Hanom_Chr16g01456921 [Helianthus anomalus]